MVKAETCDNCHGYVKVLYQIEDPDLEPLVREGGYRRGSFNPFLIGY